MDKELFKSLSMEEQTTLVGLQSASKAEARRLADLKGQTAIQEEALSAVMHELTRATESNEKAKEQADATDKRISKGQTRESNLNKLIETLEKKVLNLNVRREKAEETRKKIVAENEDLRKTKESEEAKLVTLRNKVAREEAEGEETKKQLEATIKSLKTQANELTDERNAKQIEVDTAKEELEKTNKDTKDAIRKADDFVKQARAEADQIIADAKDEQLRIVADTESTLTQIKAEHEAKTVAFNELCSNFEQKQAEFAELEQKCQATVNAMKTARQNAVNELVTAIREQGLEKDQSVVERVLKELKV